MSATAAAGGGENTSSSSSSSSSVTAQSHQHEDDEEVSLHPPRDPKLDTKANGYLETAEPFWQVVISFIKAGKQAVAEGNDDPNLTKWSKKYLPDVLDAVVKLQEHVADTKHFSGIFDQLQCIIELPVQGRPCCGRKKNDDFLSNFRECNELILTVLCAFASLRGGLYFEKEQFKDQYGNASTQFETQLSAVNNLLLDCSPTPLNGDYDNEEDALVPVESKAKNWKEYISSMIALKEEEFVKLKHEVVTSSQKLKSAINYVDPWNSQEDKEILQLNGIKLNSINKSNNNNKDPTSVEAIRQDLAAYYNDVEFSMSQSSSSSRCESGEQEGEGEAVAGKFEDFFCNLRLKKRQHREGEKQSATEGEFVSASHLPTRLRSAARTVLVTGPGGAGKTVALKHICIQQGVEDSIIVFVPLKELRGMPRHIKSIEDIFENCSVYRAISEEQIEAIVEKRIPVIFAFDGFDEVHNAQEEDKNIAHFLSDMIDPKKRKFSLENKKLTKLVRDCDRVIISSREERIASANCNLDSAEARPLVDELAVQLWTNSEVERFCLRFFSNAFNKQEQEQQNKKSENEQQLAKAVRTATNDVISSLASPLMDSWRGLPLAVTLLCQLRSSDSEKSKNILDNMSPARAYSLVLEMHWRRSKLRVKDRLLRCKTEYVHDCRKDHGLELSDGVTPELYDLVLSSAAEASFKQLLSTNSNVTEISFSSSSSSLSSSSINKLPLWAALLRETGLIRVENNSSKATFSHRSWIEFLCARHAATSTDPSQTKTGIYHIPWDQSKFASVWLLLADFARSGTFEKTLSVSYFSFFVMGKYRPGMVATFREHEGKNRFNLRSFDIDEENRKASISLLARITNVIKPEELFSPLHLVSRSSALDHAKKHLDQLPKFIHRVSTDCKKCKTHFAEAPADWKCSKCNVLMWNETSNNCEICDRRFDLLSWKSHTRCCGKCVCTHCVFEQSKVSKQKDKHFCEKCVALAVPVTTTISTPSHAATISSATSAAGTQSCASSTQTRKVNFVVEELLSHHESISISQKHTAAANSFILHLRWLAELCVAEGALNCFKFIEEKEPRALFGVFKEKDPWFALTILSPALARALDHLDRPSVSACVEYIINKYVVDVSLEDAIRVNSLVGVTRAIKKMEEENFSLDDSVERERIEKDKERGKIIVELFADAIGSRHFDVVAAMLRCRRDQKGRFLWFHKILAPKLLQIIVGIWLPRDLQFRVWCEEKKDFETSTLSDLAKVLDIDLSESSLSSYLSAWIVKVEADDTWLLLSRPFPFFHLFEKVVYHGSNSISSKLYSVTPSLSLGVRILTLRRDEASVEYEGHFTEKELERCHKLEEFDPSMALSTDASLKIIAASPSALTLRCIKLDSTNFSDEGVCLLVAKCINLQELWLGSLHSDFDQSSKFTDLSLQALASSPCVSNSTLTLLNLSNNNHFTDSAFSDLISKCSKLRIIHLSRTKLKDASLISLSNSCSSTLRVLNVSNNKFFSDGALASLVSKCSKLEELNLAGSDTKFTDSCLKAIASSPSSCAAAVLLKKLNLSKNKHFSDESVSLLVENCSQLEEIHLGGTQLSDSSLGAIATSSCASRLRLLDLSDNMNFTNENFAALISKCRQLEEINLSFTKFGDASLRALAASPSVTQQKPPTLVKIDLSWNENITDAGIDALKEAYGDSWSKVSLKRITNTFDDEVGDDEGSDWCFNVEESGTTQQEKVNSTSAATAAASG